jgi:hypothetical protein
LTITSGKSYVGVKVGPGVGVIVGEEVMVGVRLGVAVEVGEAVFVTVEVGIRVKVALAVLLGVSVTGLVGLTSEANWLLHARLESRRKLTRKLNNKRGKVVFIETII